VRQCLPKKPVGQAQHKQTHIACRVPSDDAGLLRPGAKKVSRKARDVDGRSVSGGKSGSTSFLVDSGE
jgi:hypothetical protein